jgi:translation initiation factor IF-3
VPGRRAALCSACGRLDAPVQFAALSPTPAALCAGLRAATSSSSAANNWPDPRRPRIALEREDRRNHQITAPRVRVIADDGAQLGILSTREALFKAEESGLDLVEVSPNADPPVCKIMDYGKYLYQKDKALQAAKKKQKQIQVKEIKFRPTTEEADYQTKFRSISRFLEEGDKVKIVVRFRGREMAHQELGMQVMNRLRDELGEVVQIEQFPKMEGRQSVMVISPKRK